MPVSQPIYRKSSISVILLATEVFGLVAISSPLADDQTYFNHFH